MDARRKARCFHKTREHLHGGKCARRSAKKRQVPPFREWVARGSRINNSRRRSLRNATRRSDPIKSLNKDGRADVFETVSDFWAIGGDYHEYAFGSKMDPQGNIWVALCLTGSFTSDNPWRG